MIRTKTTLNPVAFALAGGILLAMAATAQAHHPGEALDRTLGSKEKYFEAIDRPAPDFRLQDAEGRAVALSDLRDKIVVLNFIYTKCPDVCPLHAEKIAEVQRLINGTPMRNLIRFFTVTTDPRHDTPAVMRNYGPVHGLDPATWSFLTAAPGTGDDATRNLAESFGHKFRKVGNDYQSHGVVTHVIDRGGRWAANFHGLRFEAVNMVLYLNGLSNKVAPAARPEGRGPWRRIMDLFR